jgi:hypothetical protein
MFGQLLLNKNKIATVFNGNSGPDSVICLGEQGRGRQPAEPT